MSARTIADAVAYGARRLQAVGVEAPRREARLLVAHILGADVSVTLGHGERRLTPGQRQTLRGMIDRRARREPMAHITGAREFYSLPFGVSRAVLTPRPESETVIEAVLDHLSTNDSPRILDLGVGSGCLLLTLLHELPNASGIGVDIDHDAITLARRNARQLGLDRRASFVVGDWAQAVAAQFNIVVVNPPYICRGELSTLAPEVALHEPRRALDGGVDGLDAYRALAPQIVQLLGAGAVAVVEVGAGQTEAVKGIFAKSGARIIDVRRDLAGRDRALVVGTVTTQTEKKLGNQRNHE